MTNEQTGKDRRVERIRALAQELGLQVRRADHLVGGWHIVNPAIDHLAYAFSFTKPHTYNLDDVERILSQRTEAANQRMLYQSD